MVRKSLGKMLHRKTESESYLPDISRYERLLWHVFLYQCFNQSNIFYHQKLSIMNSGSKVLMGIIAGAAAGAVLGLLFAPETGVETRRKIGEGSKDLASNLKDKFSELVDGIADKYESAKEGASDLLHKGKEKVSNVAENYSEGAGNTSEASRPSYQS